MFETMFEQMRVKEMKEVEKTRNNSELPWVGELPLMASGNMDFMMNANMLTHASITVVGRKQGEKMLDVMNDR